MPDSHVTDNHEANHPEGYCEWCGGHRRIVLVLNDDRPPDQVDAYLACRECRRRASDADPINSDFRRYMGVTR